MAEPAPGGRIAGDQGAHIFWVSLGGLELPGIPVRTLAQNQLFFDPDVLS